jgi:hypothetical protein
MGITSAIFQALGKILLTNDLFMMEVIHGAITGRQSLITRIGTLSIPGALKTRPLVHIHQEKKIAAKIASVNRPLEIQHY